MTTHTATATSTSDLAMQALAFGATSTSPYTFPGPATTGAGSEVVRALEGAWDQIRSYFPELPPVVIITGSGVGNGYLKWAHFMPEGWVDNGTKARTHEIFISGERLATGAELTLQSLLHEATHLVAHLRGVQDCSRGNAYHNGEFLKLAAELGLEYTHGGPDKAIGYSAVTLTDMAKVVYGETLAHLEQAIRMSQDTFDRLLATLAGAGVDPVGASTGAGAGSHTLRLPKAPKVRRTSGAKVRLACGCGHVVQTSRRTADAMVLTCKDCGEVFSED